MGSKKKLQFCGPNHSKSFTGSDRQSHWGGAICIFGTKSCLKSTKNVVFCILFRPMRGARAPAPPPPLLPNCFHVSLLTLATSTNLLSKSNLSLYSLHYSEACYEFSRPISASLRLQATQLLLKKCSIGGQPLATLCSI